MDVKEQGGGGGGGSDLVVQLTLSGEKVNMSTAPKLIVKVINKAWLSLAH